VSTPVPDLETRLANLERATFTIAAWLVQYLVFMDEDADAIARMLRGEEDADGTPGTTYDPRGASS
jgi:hypothetical protein